MAKVAVIGLGYVGITTLVGMNKLGHEVIGYDIDQSRTVSLSKNDPPIHEEGLELELHSLNREDKLVFTSQLGELTKFKADFFFVCVPTPQSSHGAADLVFVLQVAKQLSSIAPDNSVVVLKSTVPVGSGVKVKQALARPDIQVVSNPEFLREGSALRDFMNPDLVVVGADSKGAANRVLQLYSNINSRKISTSVDSAQLIKYATNAYLATRLSFVNNLAALCEQTGANLDDVLKGLGSDSRIGSSFLNPGPGWGGSCFPKDTRALLAVASEFGLEFPLIDAALQSNTKTMDRVVEMIIGLAGGSLEGKVIGIWGLAFKANTDDIRESPSMKITEALLASGAKVRGYDPVAVATAAQGFHQARTAEEAAKGADVLVILTEWGEFAEIDPSVISSLMVGSAVLDARRIVKNELWKAEFDVFRTLGGE
jgi:UDPglucose 6-dehydrogenase